ncbi:MAG: hypothetical protein ACRDOE_00490 [Streptosporangiaceae bacterium]
MKALVFRHNLAREAASAIGGRVDRRAFVSCFAPVRLEDVAELPLPAEDWVRVETTFSGLCGSDVKQILLNGSRDNPLTALVSLSVRSVPVWIREASCDGGHEHPHRALAARLTHYGVAAGCADRGAAGHVRGAGRGGS